MWWAFSCPRNSTSWVAAPALTAIELELKKLPIRLLLLVAATLVIREYGGDTSATFFQAKLLSWRITRLSVAAMKPVPAPVAS